jgi:hypothetical protein
MASNPDFLEGLEHIRSTAMDDSLEEVMCAYEDIVAHRGGHFRFFRRVVREPFDNYQPVVPKWHAVHRQSVTGLYEQHCTGSVLITVYGYLLAITSSSIKS